MVLINNNFVRGQNPPALYEKKKKKEQTRSIKNKMLRQKVIGRGGNSLHPP